MYIHVQFGPVDFSIEIGPWIDIHNYEVAIKDCAYAFFDHIYTILGPILQLKLK